MDHEKYSDQWGNYYKSKQRLEEPLVLRVHELLQNENNTWADIRAQLDFEYMIAMQTIKRELKHKQPDRVKPLKRK